MAKVTDVKTLDDITKGKPLAEIRYTDLADIIFILQDQANAYHGLDECCDELTVDQFTEWLGTMKGSVELVEIIPRPKD